MPPVTYTYFCSFALLPGTQRVIFKVWPHKTSDHFYVFHLHVLDSKGPLVLCPNNVERCTNGTNVVRVWWLEGLPRASDDVDGSIDDITCIDDDRGNVVASGESYRVGVTSITCTEVDGVVVQSDYSVSSLSLSK